MPNIPEELGVKRPDGEKWQAHIWASQTKLINYSNEPMLINLRKLQWTYASFNANKPKEATILVNPSKPQC